MPVVIKELVITATVAPLVADKSPAAAAADEATSLGQRQVRQLVQDCVAQVLAVLREQGEC